MCQTGAVLLIQQIQCTDECAMLKNLLRSQKETGMWVGLVVVNFTLCSAFPLFNKTLKPTSEFLTYSVTSSNHSNRFPSQKKSNMPMALEALGNLASTSLPDLSCGVSLPYSPPFLPPLISLKMRIQCETNKSQTAKLIFVLDNIISK